MGVGTRKPKSFSLVWNWARRMKRSSFAAASQTTIASSRVMPTASRGETVAHARAADGASAASAATPAASADASLRLRVIAPVLPVGAPPARRPLDERGREERDHERAPQPVFG